MIRLLKGNYTTVFRDPEEILAICKPTFSQSLSDRLETVLLNLNLAKFDRYITAV